jgi:hypothetical protein
MIHVVVMLALFAAGPADPGPEYAAAIESWRAGRVERLKSEDGWLTLVGLHWLEPGENRFGSDPELPIVLEAPGVPAWAGTFRLEAGEVRVEAAPDSPLRLGDGPLSGPTLVRDDSQEQADVLALGRLKLYVIRRGDRFAIRVKDPASPVRTGFTGIESFPIDPSYRIDARLERFEQPLEVAIPTAAGTTERMQAPGRVVFTLGGAKKALLPLVEEPGETSLWFIFKDKTSGKETYGFRYLYGDLREDGTVDLDFNRAYNPPCAFTPYATCALPPKENHLDARVEAGERIYGAHHP